MRRVLLTFVALSFSFACGGSDAPTCTNTCAAAALTQCAGTQVQTCSMAANGCLAFGAATSCPTGQVCSGSSCQTTNAACSSANCTGCCFNGACQAGTTTTACGKSGAACAACGTNQICKTTQACGVDPDSTWKVQPTAATITATNNGAAWDGDGSPPDPYVNMSCNAGTTVTSTPVAQDTLSPTWSAGGCTAKASYLLASPWIFQVFDSDLTTPDPITGALQYQLTEAAFQSGSVNLTGTQGLQTIAVQLQKQ